MTRNAHPGSVALLAAVLLSLAAGPIQAEVVIPCDFFTGSGKIQVTGGKASFGASGGVKNGAFWGDLVYDDPVVGLSLQATSVTKYYGPGATTRVIEGVASTNIYGNRTYRVTAADNERLGTADTFRIALDNGYVASGALRSGDIKLRSGNRSSTAPAGYACGPPDTQSPTATITSPGNGATVSGTITVSASASDDVGVAGVQFELDGASLGAEDTSAPYQVTWDTTSATGGTHTLTALARDTVGNTATSPTVTVTVQNGPPPDTSPPSVSITSPTSGSTVSGAITVSANASDNVGVAGVQFRLDGAPLGAEDTAAPYSVAWDTTTAGNGSHTLSAVARDAAGNTSTASASVTVSNFASGDVLVGLIDGRVQWRGADGSLKGTLTSSSDGQVSSLAFDTAGRLYVPHWWGKSAGVPGNLVERFGRDASLLGTFGSGYNSDPSSMAIDAAGNVYVGQADDTGDVLKFDPNGNLLASFNVAVVNRGTDHIDLASDGCTIFYTSRSQDVLRYNVCTNAQLPIFNTQPLPGEAAYHLRVLPDGGVLVADSRWIVRLDASGNQAQLYEAAGESNYWGGVDHAGDGTFWASNAYNGNIYRFDLASGAILAGFNTGTGNFTAAGVAVRR